MAIPWFIERQLAFYRRLIDALSDPARRNRVMLALALAYAICWTLYATIAKSSQGMNADMAEMVVWGGHFEWGYPKHPPFLPWVIGAWFAVMPRADWAFYLLSGLNLGAGLYVSFLLAGEWLEGEKRAIAPFLLALIPFYNFLGLKLDQNSGMIVFWALTIWAFMRSLDTRKASYAAIAGLAAAATVLTKYWGAFLVLALILAALYDRRRSLYFRSAAPWVSALIGGIIVAPHVVWLIQNDFPPTKWVATRRMAATLAEALGSLPEYTFGTLGYAAAALIVVAIFARPTIAASRDSLLPREPERRTAAIIFWVPLLVPYAFAFVSYTNLLSLWNTASLALLPVILLSSPLVTLRREGMPWIAATAATITIAPLLVAPLIAYATVKTGVENYAAYARPAAARIESEWKATTAAPLKILAGPFALADTAAFYLSERVETWADYSSYLSPRINERVIARDGMAIICPADDPGCLGVIDAEMKKGAMGRRTEVEIVPRWFGFAGTPNKFIIATIAPHS